MDKIEIQFEILKIRYLFDNFTEQIILAQFFFGDYDFRKISNRQISEQDFNFYY